MGGDAKGSASGYDAKRVWWGAFLQRLQSERKSYLIRQKAAEMAKEEERKLEDIKDKVATGQATIRAQAEQMEAILESLDKGAEAERQLKARIEDRNVELNEVLQVLADKAAWLDVVKQDLTDKSYELAEVKQGLKDKGNELDEVQVDLTNKKNEVREQEKQLESIKEEAEVAF